MSKFTTGFSDGAVLLAAELNAIGDWASYTPTMTVWTQGNGTLTGAYLQIDKIVWFYLRLLWGSTTSATASAPIFTVPANMETSTEHQRSIPQTVACRAFDADGNGYYGGMCYYVSTSTLSPQATGTASTYASSAGYTTTVPFTWTTSDEILISGWYRAA